VIDVPDRPDIQVRLVALEFFLRHCCVCSSARAFAYIPLEFYLYPCQKTPVTGPSLPGRPAR
jgi:hypothetical protein